MFRNFFATAVLMAPYALAISNPSGIGFLPEGRRILAPGHGSYLLDQCSRNTPEAVVSYWRRRNWRRSGGGTRSSRGWAYGQGQTLSGGWRR